MSPDPTTTPTPAPSTPTPTPTAPSPTLSYFYPSYSVSTTQPDGTVKTQTYSNPDALLEFATQAGCLKLISILAAELPQCGPYRYQDEVRSTFNYKWSVPCYDLIAGPNGEFVDNAGLCLNTILKYSKTDLYNAISMQVLGVEYTG